MAWSRAVYALAKSNDWAEVITSITDVYNPVEWIMHFQKGI